MENNIDSELKQIIEKNLHDAYKPIEIHPYETLINADSFKALVYEKKQTAKSIIFTMEGQHDNDIAAMLIKALSEPLHWVINGLIFAGFSIYFKINDEDRISKITGEVAQYLAKRSRDLVWAMRAIALLSGGIAIFIYLTPNNKQEPQSKSVSIPGNTENAGISAR